jgi:hypothetical protein
MSEVMVVMRREFLERVRSPEAVAIFQAFLAKRR